MVIELNMVCAILRKIPKNKTMDARENWMVGEISMENGIVFIYRYDIYLSPIQNYH
jgi:hypothetical protein